MEILLPEFWDPISGPIFPNKGDQERFWRMTRRFVEALQQATGAASVKAVRTAVFCVSGVCGVCVVVWVCACVRACTQNA